VRARLLRRRREGQRGQSMVEMALILPVLLMLVIGTLEFGFAFDHHLTLEYATREGARAGAALANGTGFADGETTECSQFPTDPVACVDPMIIAAVQRVLTSPGSPVELSDVQSIRIYRAGADGQTINFGCCPGSNTWTYSSGAGAQVGGVELNFLPPGTNRWPVANRNNTAVNTDSIGIEITYRYSYRTPFRFLFGGLGIDMVDRTVMQLNPTDNS
jgi:Flp pilus assembly protein TadG